MTCLIESLGISWLLVMYPEGGCTFLYQHHLVITETFHSQPQMWGKIQGITKTINHLETFNGRPHNWLGPWKGPAKGPSPNLLYSYQHMSVLSLSLSVNWARTSSLSTTSSFSWEERAPSLTLATSWLLALVLASWLFASSAWLGAAFSADCKPTLWFWQLPIFLLLPFLASHFMCMFWHSKDIHIKC